ncbi:MAG: S41 family peptidase [Bacteroidota bacterium]
MYKPFTYLAFFIALTFSLSCKPSQTSNRLISNPEKTFESFFSTTQKNYANFGIKRINWDSVYQVYKPKINSQTSDKELKDILAESIYTLNDGHVSIFTPLGWVNSKKSHEWGAFPDRTPATLKEDKQAFYTLLGAKYFDKSTLKRSNCKTDFSIYCWLKPALTKQKIGYYIPSFQGEDCVKLAEQMAQEFQTADMVIIDLRYNPGGMGYTYGRKIAGHFVSQPIDYCNTYQKKESLSNEFQPALEWMVRPAKPNLGNKKMYVLTNRWTISAGDHFALLLKLLPTATLIGENTVGAFGKQQNFELPNGWKYTLTVSRHAGVDGTIYEGKGISPAFRVVNTFKDIQNGNDLVLEKAIQLIQGQ